MKGLRLFRVLATFVAIILAGVGFGIAGEKGDPKAGRARYEALCASCHGMAGKGDGPAAAALPVKPKNHTDGKSMNAFTDKDVFEIIKKGGAAVKKSALMPAWERTLNDQDIENVVAYIRSLGVPPYKPSGK